MEQEDATGEQIGLWTASRVPLPAQQVGPGCFWVRPCIRVIVLVALIGGLSLAIGIFVASSHTAGTPSAPVDQLAAPATGCTKRGFGSTTKYTLASDLTALAGTSWW